MKFISHRGNISGAIKILENTKEYILQALDNNYNVEIDIWYINKKLYLGHDIPNEQIDITFLNNKKIWCHAKTIETLFFLIGNDIHTFYHKVDAVTLTSKNILWTYPKKKLTPLSICITHDKVIKKEYYKCYGICSDNIKFFKDNMKCKQHSQ